MKRNCLGNLLEECKRYSIKTIKQSSVPCYVNGSGLAIRIGHFVFGSNSHSTGISVNVQILNLESGHAFEIINGTYWYSESTYGFNKFKRLSGKWDKSLQKSISELRSLLMTKLHEDAIEENAFTDKKQLAAKQEIDVVESLF